jgi:hypothetical protein
VICKPPVAGTQMVAEPLSTWTNVWAYAVNPAVQEILIIESTKVKGWLLRRNVDKSWPEDPEPIPNDSFIALDTIGLKSALIDAYATTPFADEAEPGATQRACRDAARCRLP